MTNREIRYLEQIHKGDAPNRPNFKPRLIKQGMIFYNDENKKYELTILGKEVLSQEIMKHTLGISRQRKWQLKMKSQGHCNICGKKAKTKSHCEKHAYMHSKKALKRYYLKKGNKAETMYHHRTETHNIPTLA